MSVRTADVAIVGGGLMGAWTAYFLARRGTRVAVLDKGLVGAQASGVNFGNLRLQGRPPGQYPLALRSHALWETLDTLIGERCEFAATGHLYIAADYGEHGKLAQYAKDAEDHGLSIERLSGDELRQRWPWLGGELHSGTFSARDATANPRLVSPAVMRAARRLGTRVLQNTRVVGALAEGDGFVLETSTGERVSCAKLVNTAGAWALEIAERFGESAQMFAAGAPQILAAALAPPDAPPGGGGGRGPPLPADAPPGQPPARGP